MAVKWTEEQERVIRVRDRDVLVSAAAGSGKTAVLVERILGKITDTSKPVDIDRLLVVTFTNAAASEMRERIRLALEERSGKDPENVQLQRQLVLVHNAKITTIHSFCLQVLRSHFQTVGIDPSFRIADEGEVLLLEQDAVQETVNEAYEEASRAAGEESAFTEFLEQFATGKTDTEVEEMILRLYHFALGGPFPDKWLSECRQCYDRPFSGEDGWIAFVVEDTRRRLGDIQTQLERALALSAEPDGPYPYEKALRSDLELTGALQRESSFSSLLEAFRNLGAFARLSTKKDASISEEKKEMVRSIRADCKDQLLALRDQYFYEDGERMQEAFSRSGTVIRVLTGLTEDFMRRLEKKKAEKNILDFGDLEHFALRALLEPAEDGGLTPTAVAREYAETFEEVMIDEYQDSNLVQELLLKSVSGKGVGAHNRFMVGDVKQSIYRFRLARPELFMEQFYACREQEKTGTACRIDLDRNFRSRPQVLSSVNFLFRRIMTEALGGVPYDEAACLHAGAAFPEGAGEDGQGEDPYRTEILLMDQGGAEGLDGPAGSLREEEARMVGRRILELVGRLPVLDSETKQQRPARFGDIVLLLRTVSGWAEVFGEVLSDMGIPCHCGSQRGYFSTAEIRTVLAYLQILDNPIQDIPLAAVLRSAIGGLTDEEMAALRLAGNPGDSYYDCARAFLRGSGEERLRQKLERFFETYEMLREKSGHTPVHQLLWELLDATGYGEYASALPAGEQRKANLDMLVEKAMAYEATSFRGLYHFVRYIENLQKYEVDYGEASLGGEAGNVVRLLSIHKSKGLEFPIVFACGLGKQFNESDLRGKVLMDAQWGIACDCIAEEQTKGGTGALPVRLRRPTLLKKAIGQKTASENLGEELRVLYVAMTRAKEKLILCGSVRDQKRRLPAWRQAAEAAGEGTLPYSWLLQASSYLDWVMPALFLEQAGECFGLSPESPLQNVLDRQSVVLEDAVTREELLNLDPQVCQDEEAREFLQKTFAKAYPYEANREIPGTLSVSELKKRSQEEDEPEDERLKTLPGLGTGEEEPEEAQPLIPRFLRKDGPVSGGEGVGGALRGTVYHTFMENLDFSKKEDLRFQLEELISCGKMSQEEASLLRISDISAFLRTDLAARMERAAQEGRLFREQPFVLGIPAGEIRAQWRGSGDEDVVLVQGIIDAYFVEGDEITVVDYKTDRVREEETLTERYRGQLGFYSEALERLTGKRIRERILYSFCLKKLIYI